MFDKQPIVVLGKLPERGDFVRSRAAGEIERAFELWLQRNVERSHGKIPAFCVRFLVRLDDGGSPLAGTWAPSCDAVGRAFPLALTTRVPAELAALPWPLLPSYYGTFFARAEECLAGAADAPFASVIEEADALEQPHPSSAPRALYDAMQTLSALHTGEFASQLFGGDWQDALAYALSALRQGAGQVDLTLDYPALDPEHLYVWFELTRACLHTRSVPAALLWASDGKRGLAALGPPSDQLVSFLLEPEHASQRRWPLWTQRAHATASSRERLPAAVRAHLENGESYVHELVRLLEVESP